MDVVESQEALWSLLDNGTVELNQSAKGDLSNGDFGHYYTIQVVAGETLGFHVEWRLPESALLGAKLVLTNSNGYQILAKVVESDSNVARLDYTFKKDGTYRIYVAQRGYVPWGRYPYVLSVFDHVCAVWQGAVDVAALELSNVEVSELGVVDFALAQNFQVGGPQERDPWSSDPRIDPAFSVDEHTVVMGRSCADLKVDECPEDGPLGGLGYGDFMFGSAGVAANECELMNQVYDWAGDTSAALVGYDACAELGPYCEQVL